MCNVNMIVATDMYGGFGKDGKIPWNFPTDFKFFKDKTKGYPCLMGKNTYLDLIQIVSKVQTSKQKTSGKDLLPIDKDPLPDRTITVLTSDSTIPLYGSTNIVSSVDEFLYDNSGQTVFICGGANVYRSAFSYADVIYLTAIGGDYECDRFFPVELLHRNFEGHPIKKVREKGVDLHFMKYVRKQK